MTDIAAADTTGQVRSRLVIPTGQAGAPLMLVTVACTTDPGTTDSYPTGGILLSPLFTTGDASDTYLDVGQPILQIGAVMVRNSITSLTPFTAGYFYNGGATAAAQTLVLGQLDTSARGAGRITAISGTGIAAADANTITDSGNGLGGLSVGEPIMIQGFTGTAANNQIAIVDTVAAGTIDVHVPVALTGDAAGETVTLRSLWPANFVQKEHANSDITVAGDVAAGDTDIYYTISLLGRLRPGISPSLIGL